MGNDNKKEKTDTLNIFDDFIDDSSLKENIKEIVKDQEKDVFYYIKIIQKVLKILIFLLLIFVVLAYSYVSIQKNNEYKNSSFIDPLCFIILWDIVNNNIYCSSVESLFNQYTQELKTLKNEQLSSINDIFETTYKIENFLDSKEVIFLKNKTDTKLDVVTIIDKFDKLLNTFETISKEKLHCFNMEVFSDNTLKVSCEAFSAWYDTYIKWYDWTAKKSVWWTSISYANSFINFIKTQYPEFLIINEQKMFDYTPLLLEDNWFTDKTKFSLELKYDSENINF